VTLHILANQQAD